MIPKIIHQTWKTKDIPKKWLLFVNKVRTLNPDWEYKLWTDADNDLFVKKEYPEFYDIFKGFPKGIMRADVIRYLIMYRIGGVYADLDYEILKPFDFGTHKIVLPLNRSVKFGDKENTLGNCFFASEPNHQFWSDVINELKNHPPTVTNINQIVAATGPELLTRIYNKNKHLYTDIYLPERIIYHPPSPNNKKDIRKIKANGTSLGIHHPWGSWKERGTPIYFINKLKKLYSSFSKT